MNMNKWLVFTAIFSIVGSAPAVLAADAAAGKASSVSCAGCHGADGNSTNPQWPKLAGQGEKYLAKQLQDFKDSKRTNATMAPMVAALSEQDMQNLAAFYASQTASKGAADESLVAAGEKFYRGGNPASGVAACIGCHGPNGAGNPAAGFPALNGQHATYVENQLKNFASGERDNDPSSMMGNISEKMTDKEIKAVASYVQGLH